MYQCRLRVLAAGDCGVAQVSCFAEIMKFGHYMVWF